MLLHAFVSRSRVNGPGLRAVVYLQGCSLRCRNCWNLETHAFTGKERTLSEVADLIVRAQEERPLDGVTFSGGEPMQQADVVLSLMESLRERLAGLSFGMYSGYSQRELSRGLYWCRSQLTQREKQRIWQTIKSHLDFAVLGRFADARPSALPLRTSTNQTLELFSDRYSEEDFGPQEVEVQIDSHGTVQISGFPIAGMPI
jgi:anaerobic ribonucleoside-triphosphate reductase activating protein